MRSASRSAGRWRSFRRSGSGLFSDDAAVLETGSIYLRIVAPFYPLFGAGVALYFASQGAGQVLRPVLAGTVRLVLVVAGGALVMQLRCRACLS